MTEDERQDLLRTVAERREALKDKAVELPPKAPALKTAIKAEREAFLLKRALQQIVVEDLEHADEDQSLPEVRRGVDSWHHLNLSSLDKWRSYPQ